MASYKIVNADQLDADLTAVADSIRAKGETTGELAFPAGFQEAIANISTGIDVQRNSGTFTLKSGSATVNCGFKPDVVMIHKKTKYENNYQTCAVNFADDTRGTTLETGLWEGSSGVEIHEVTVTQTATGFNVKMTEFSDEWENSNSSGTFQYSAVKFTE